MSKEENKANIAEEANKAKKAKEDNKVRVHGSVSNTAI
jgi:hypothetical protein